MDLSHLQFAARLLNGIERARLRTLGIEALRQCRRTQQPRSRDIAMGTFGWKLASLITETMDVTAKNELTRAGSSFSELCAGNGLDYEQMQPVLEFALWFSGAGFAYPRVGDPKLEYSYGRPVYPTVLRLTDAGVRLLDSQNDHPLLPGFLDRAATRCPGLPDGGLVPFLDAYACLEHRLARPATVLLGVAYEAFVERVIDVLVARGSLPADTLAKNGAAKRIVALRSVVPATVVDKDERYSVIAALDFADLLRERRNDGSHTTPRFAFDDIGEVEELLVSAGRHLPALWRLAQ